MTVTQPAAKMLVELSKSQARSRQSSFANLSSCQQIVGILLPHQPHRSSQWRASGAVVASSGALANAPFNASHNCVAAYGSLCCILATLIQLEPLQRGCSHRRAAIAADRYVYLSPRSSQCVGDLLDQVSRPCHVPCPNNAKLRRCAAQDVVAGDGTTSVVVICGALLKKAQELLARGVHPTVVADSFNKAAIKACEVSSEGVAMRLAIRLMDYDPCIMALFCCAASDLHFVAAMTVAQLASVDAKKYSE